MNRDKILVLNNTNSETAKTLAKELDTEVVSKIPFGFEGVVLCFAHWKNEVIPQKCLVLNKPESIRLCSDKRKSLKILNDNGITTPKIYCAGLESVEFPCVARTKNHHSGKGFWLCLNRGDLKRAFNNGASYVVKYVPVKEEYRIHVFNEKVIDVRKKVRNETVTEEQTDYNIRSVHKGWKFVEKNTTHNIPENVLEECTKAVSVLGLDFGAVDLLLSDDNTYYVLEVNSSPGLSMTNTLEKYCEEITKIVNNHYQYTKTYTEREVFKAISEVLRFTRLYNKPYVLVSEFKTALQKKNTKNPFINERFRGDLRPLKFLGKGKVPFF